MLNYYTLYYYHFVYYYISIISGVTSNSLHPGVVRTEIMRELPLIIKYFTNKSFELFFKVNQTLNHFISEFNSLIKLILISFTQENSS